jgi:hypothetical protein
MVTRAVRHSPALPFQILNLRNLLKVTWIYAVTYTTNMVDLQSRSDRANHHSVRETMHEPSAVPSVNLSITVRHYWAAPDPTSTVIDFSALQ